MPSFAADTYSIRARVLPALVVLTPVMVAVSCLSLEDRQGWGIGGALFAAAAVGMLGQVGRDAGKSKENALFLACGGNPATGMLRHRDGRLNQLTKERYHSKLAGLRPDLRMPSAASEESAPEPADRVYETCVDFLREATRDHGQFGLVFAENVNYGFRRNLWAMKPTGMVLSVAGLLLCALVENEVRLQDKAVPIFVDAAMLAFWLARVTSGWVRTAAEAYAERLLGACDLL